jgi:hypothetical protein
LQAAESSNSAMQAGTSMAHSTISRPTNQHHQRIKTIPLIKTPNKKHINKQAASIKKYQSLKAKQP